MQSQSGASARTRTKHRHTNTSTRTNTPAHRHTQTSTYMHKHTYTHTRTLTRTRTCTGRATIREEKQARLCMHQKKIRTSSLPCSQARNRARSEKNFCVRSSSPRSLRACCCSHANVRWYALAPLSILHRRNTVRRYSPSWYYARARVC